MDNWERYSISFSKNAKQAGFADDDIEACLDYAHKLFDQELPIIYDQTHLSLLIGYDEEYLRKVSNSQIHFYRRYTIPKKSGGKRTIAEPLPSLKEIQHWIMKEILYKIPASRFAKAYIEGSSIKQNAIYHKNQKYVLSIDIKDFFGSLRFRKVYTLFHNLGYSKPVSTMLSNLCTLYQSLPQGAPTSPALSNLLMTNVDKRISGFVINKKIRYTRYADDMTFSGDFNPGMVIKFVAQVLSDEGLIINDRKTRFRGKNQQQEVTGVVVNEKLQAPKVIRKQLRQAVYYIEKYGLPSHLEKTNNQRANHIRHLIGLANFILFINKEDQEARKYIDILKGYLD